MIKQILLIDDEEQDRLGMTIALKKDGYTDLRFAPTAEDGLALAASLNPDLIFIDVVLNNNIDVFDLCQQLRSAGNKAKIIMVTGHLDAVNVKKARVSGANEIVEKIVGFKNLAVAIKQVCS